MYRKSKFILLCLLIPWMSSILVPMVHAETPGKGKTVSSLQAKYPDHIQRTAELGKLWALMRWVHPALVEGKIDWDRQLVDALPAIAKADSPDAQKPILEQMLACLNDPVLRIGPHVEQVYVTPAEDTPRITKLVNGNLLISIHDGISPFSPSFKGEVKATLEAAAEAKSLVIDLRPNKDSGFSDATDFLKNILVHSLAKPLDPPSARYVYNRGWPSQSFTTSGGYFTAWMSQHSEPFKPEPSAKSIPMAFIVDASSQIPMLVLALQKAGLAYILAVGDSPALWVPVATQSFGPLEITYKSGEVMFQDGTVGSGPDLAIDADTRIGPDSPAVKAALALLESKKAPGSNVHWRSAAALPLREADKPYKEMVNPNLAWRQFAVIRLWAVVDAFFPYKDLMEKPWSEALPEFLAQMELVNDGEGYARALARMSALLQDNHVRILGHPILDQLRGEAGLPFSLRMVERSVLIDEIVDVPGAQDLKPWDEVLEVDGESVGEFFRRLTPFVAAANPWTMDRNLVLRLGRGRDRTVAKLKVRGANGEVRDVSITRSNKFPIAYPKTLHKGEIIQVLSNGIGYVDLGRLMPSQVEDLFTKIKDTKALIMDMRGYPNGTAWPISPYLNSRKATYGASFYPTTLCGAAGEAEIGTVNFMQNLPINHGEPIYQGKVVMLINEMTQSQAEHSGLFYEAACDATFIGSPTAGSNGDVTDLMLPGGIRVTFTGQGVKHADGRQLQRVGLQPKVFVRPTVMGVREGKDEVMDRAIRYIQEAQ